jgi:hypothetical protein
MKKIFVVLQCVFIVSLIGCGTPEGGGDSTSSSGDGSTGSGSTDGGTTNGGSTDGGTTTDNSGGDGSAVDNGGSTVSLPSTIASLSALAKNKSVDLTWSVVDGADGYTLYYAKESMAGLSSLSEVVALSEGRIVGGLSGLSLELPDLTNGTEYFFTMTAVNSAGESGRSAEVRATPLADDGSPQNLVAVAGNQSVELSWSKVDEADSYNVYVATESFSSLGNIVNYATLSNAQLIQDVLLPSNTVNGLTNDTPYFFVVTATSAGLEGAMSSEASATPVASASGVSPFSLTDTGIDFGVEFPDYLNDSNAPGEHNVGCEGTFIGQQDCSIGLDATNNDGTDGFAGFSYTKLDALGSPLDSTETFWNCVKDNVTGLVWEVKQGGNGFKADQGLHDIDDIFSWYNSSIAENGRDSGGEDSQPLACFGYTSADENLCNTEAFVARVNKSKLCGIETWRMPTPNELLSLVHFGNGSPAIDTAYFPNVKAGTKFWTNGSDPENTESHKAWVVLFDVKNAATLTGGNLIISESKVAGRAVRLVSGE